MEKNINGETKPKGFYLKMDWDVMFDEFEDEQVGRMIKNCYRYLSGRELIETDKAEFLIFRYTIIPVLEFNLKKYSTQCEHNREVGKKGGRPPKNETRNNPPGYFNTIDNPSGIFENPNNPKEKDIDKNKEIESKKVTELENEAETKFRRLLDLPIDSLEDENDNQFVFKVRILEQCIGWSKIFKMVLNSSDTQFNELLPTLKNQQLEKHIQSIREQYPDYLNKLIK